MPSCSLSRCRCFRFLVKAQPGWVFFTSIVAIAALADWLRRATEQLAERAGSTIGGLLNVSFGNTAELVLALFVLQQAQIRVVQAQITGSIIGTTLLFLGISALVGGVGRPRQTFNQASAGLLSTLLFLVVVAILLPAVFDLTQRAVAPRANISFVDEHLSLGVSIVLLVLYAANLVYTLVTHRDLFAGEAPRGEASWSLARALLVMAAGTGLIALEAELASTALKPTSEQLCCRRSLWALSCWRWLVPHPISSLPSFLPGKITWTSFSACASARRFNRISGCAGSGAGLVDHWSPSNT